MKNFKMKWGLIIKALLFVVLIVGLKAIFYFLNFEFIAVGPVITALVAGVFFVIAIILSGVLSDFKESEKIPGDLAASIEALYKDAMLTGTKEGSAGMIKNVQDLTHTIITNFKRKGNWKLTEVNTVIDRIDEDIRVFVEKGVPMPLIVKLRNEIGSIKRISNRIEVIKETSFLPAGQAIAEFAIGSTLLVMLLLRLDPYYEGLLLIGVISLIFISVVLLIRDMDNPFDGYAQVDLSQLDKLEKYLDTK
jgi:hypothetical protein